MYDVVALGELLVDIIQNGSSAAGNPVFEAYPGGAPQGACNAVTPWGFCGSLCGRMMNRQGKLSGMGLGKDVWLKQQRERGDVLKGVMPKVQRFGGAMFTQGIVMMLLGHQEELPIRRLCLYDNDEERQEIIA